MKPFAAKLFHRFAATSLVSSNVAIGTASAFVLVAAVLSLAMDRLEPAGSLGRDWGLRGALGPDDTVPVAGPVHAATPKVPHLG